LTLGMFHRLDWRDVLAGFVGHVHPM
jgi:hypothetical protein